MTRNERNQTLLDEVKRRIPPPPDALSRVHSRRRVRARRARVGASVVGLAVAAAVVGTSVLWSTRTTEEGTVRPANDGSRAPLVAEAGEYYYVRMGRYISEDGDPPVQPEPSITEIWYGPDDSGRVVDENGDDERFSPGDFPAEFLSELSSDPDTLLRQLMQRGAPGGASPNPIATSSPGRSQETTSLLRTLQDLLNLSSEAFLTPEQTAAVFEAAQSIDEVTTEANVRDPLGRSAVRLSFLIDYDYRSGSSVEWYFDPDTRQFMAEVWIDRASEQVTDASLIEAAGIVKSMRRPPTSDALYVPEANGPPVFR